MLISRLLQVTRSVIYISIKNMLSVLSSGKIALQKLRSNNGAAEDAAPEVDRRANPMVVFSESMSVLIWPVMRIVKVHSSVVGQFNFFVLNFFVEKVILPIRYPSEWS